MKDRKLNLDINASVRRLELGLKRLVRTRRSGFYPSLFKGKGLEFDGYREYNYGDDASLIDWKASMRTNQLIVKRFREERDLKILFIVDVSDKMVFGSTKKLKCEYASELAASLSYVILREGDRAGFCFFSDEVKKFVAPSSGLVNFHRFVNSLKDPKNYGGKSNLKKVLEELSLFLSRDYIAIIISDFLGPINWISKLRIFSEKLETIGIKIEDPRDYELPKGVNEIVVSDPDTGNTMLVDVKLVRDRYEKYARKHRQIVEKMFKANGIDLLTLSTNESFITPLISFFNRRKGWK